MQQATTCYGLSQELPCFDADSCQARCRGVYQHITHLGPTLPPGVQLQEVLEGASAAESRHGAGCNAARGQCSPGAPPAHCRWGFAWQLPGMLCLKRAIDSPKPFCIMRACLISGEYCAATCCFQTVCCRTSPVLCEGCHSMLGLTCFRSETDLGTASASPSSWDIYVLKAVQLAEHALQHIACRAVWQCKELAICA